MERACIFCRNVPPVRRDLNGRAMDSSQKENDQKLKNRARAFTGAFVGMVSPVLLAIVLKKTNLKGVGKYQGTTRMLEGFVIDLFQEIFPFLAAVTLLMGMMPFLCAMVSECASNLDPKFNYITERFQGLSKIVVFVSNILLMVLGCGVLAFIHKNAWFSNSVVSACLLVAFIVILWHFCSCRWWWCSKGSADNNNVRDKKEYHRKLEQYHRKLEHSLEFSSGITAMMFLVLGSVVLEGLLRSIQLSQPLAAVPSEAPLAAVPSEAPTTKEPGTFLAATLVVSFFTGAFGALLMNVWTIPLVVLETGKPPQDETLPISTPAPSGDAGGSIDNFALGLNIALVILAIVVVVLITWEGLQVAAWLILFPPFMLLLVLLMRRKDGDNVREDGEETKPAPLELTKVTFTGFLAVAVPGITSASPGAANKVFVFFTAATVVLGLLWRLLTHHNAPPYKAVRKAVNHSSFLALAFLFCAGISFGVMAVNAAK